ncbi:MAG: RNA polymerase sigma factor [Actinomycetota bacterium]
MNRGGTIIERELRATVDRARRGEPDAWEQLYIGSYAHLLAYARRRIPQGEEADDAVSETFVRAYSGIERFKWRKQGGFEAWLHGILRNVVLETVRARGRKTPLSARDGHSPGEEEPSLWPGPLERVLADEEEETVRLAFARLSSGDQELLELRVVSRLNANEVASVLGKRPGAVRMAQSRALGRLRSLMERQGR